MVPRCVQTKFATPAQLVETDRSEGADEREASCKWKKIRSEVVFEGHSAKDNSEDGIDQAYENHMRWHCPEIVQPFDQRVLEVRWTDRANYRQLARGF